MLRQQTEQIRSTFDTVRGLNGVSGLKAASGISRTVAWAVVGVLVVGGILFCTQSVSPTTMEPLFGNRNHSPNEIDQMAIALSKSGLTGWKRDEDQILVPRGSQHEYLAALENSPALPYTLKQGGEESEAGGYFESESARRLRVEITKSRKLSNTIMATFADIAWANVEYDRKETGGFDNQVIQSASVVLVPRNGKPIAPSRVSMVQNLVSAAYAGMNADQVTVTDSSARKTYSGADDPQTRQLRQAEYELEQRLTELLDGYRGVRIAVKSEPIPNRSREHTVNKPVAIAKSIHQDHFLADYRMHVSVGLPESQFHLQWINDYRSRHPETKGVVAPTADELASVKVKVVDNIREAVTPLIGSSSPETVSIWSFPDSGKTFAYLNPNERRLDVDSAIAFAKENMTVVASIGALAFITLFFSVAATGLRLRTTRVSAASVSPVDASVNAAGKAAEKEKRTTMELKDDLTELVESNPELAAQIVHSWIVKAA